MTTKDNNTHTALRVNPEKVQDLSDGFAGTGLAVGKARIRLEGADGTWPIQLRGEIERSGFAAIWVAALVLFAAIKDSIGATDHGFLTDIVGEADTRPEIDLIPSHQILIH